MSTTSRLRLVLGAILVIALASAALASDPFKAYRAMGLKPQQVLSGSVLTSRLTTGEEKFLVAAATYFPGKREKAEAVNVKMMVFRDLDGTLSPLYTRDFGQERGVHTAHGELQLVDLDGDGANEIIVSYETLADPLIRERRGEVIVYDGGSFHPAWEGVIEFDATRAARKVAAERRDHYKREIDIAATLKTRGRTLFFDKTVVAVAGQRLDAPSTVQESAPLKR